MRALLILFVAIGCTGCSTAVNQSSEADTSLAGWATRLNNSDIEWDGQFIGLVPQVTGEPAQQLLAAGSTSIPLLLTALNDPERFAAAHVLLTMLNQGTYKTDSSEWNGLRVTLTADGRTVLYPEQMEELQRYWQARGDS